MVVSAVQQSNNWPAIKYDPLSRLNSIVTTTRQILKILLDDRIKWLRHSYQTFTGVTKLKVSVSSPPKTKDLWAFQANKRPRITAAKLYVQAETADLPRGILKQDAALFSEIVSTAFSAISMTAE
jgi:hypothetical protein